MSEAAEPLLDLRAVFSDSDTSTGKVEVIALLEETDEVGFADEEGERLRNVVGREVFDGAIADIYSNSITEVRSLYKSCW